MADGRKKGLSGWWILCALVLGACTGWILAGVTYAGDPGCLDVCLTDRGFSELSGAFLGGMVGLLVGLFAWGSSWGRRR